MSRTPITDSAPRIARWLEQRLSSTRDAPLVDTVLYGITVIDQEALLDPAGLGARTSFIARAETVELGIARVSEPVDGFDALGMACAVWLPVPGPTARTPSAAHRFTGRRRATAVAVATDDGSACAIRFDDEPEHVVMMAGPAVAGLVVPLAVVWARARAQARRS